MRKKFLSIGVISIIFLATLAVWYVYPKPINKTLEGISYQLGVENAAIEDDVTIKVNGKLHRSLLGKKTFRGTMEIDGEVLPTAKADVEEIEVNFGTLWSGGPIQNWEFENNRYTGLYTYGVLFINDNFSELTIAKYENPQADGTSWSGVDGIMISAPANNRTEALNVSNHLMSSFLKQPLE